MQGRLVRLAIGSVLGLASVCALAQSVPPSAPTPGSVQSTLPAKPVQPAPESAPTIQKPASPASPSADGGITVLVKQFVLTGNTVFSSAALQSLLAGETGKRLTLNQLYDAADTLTAYYRKHGYGLAYVTLPAQTLKDGAVRLQVVEGRIGNLAIQGNDNTDNETLFERVSSVQQGEVYTDAAMQRAVMLLNDLPGVQARAVLSPGADFGTSNVLFNVQETPYAGSISADDYGRSVIGRWRVNADARVNSLTGNGDQLSAGVTHSSGNLLNFGKLGYSLPLGPAGGTLSASFNRAIYHVGGSLFGPLNISGSTQNGGLNYLYAAERSRSENFYWGLGATHNTSRVNSGGQNLVTTNINLLQLTAFYNRVYPDYSYYTLAGNLWTNGKTNDGTSNSAEKLRMQFDASYVEPFWTQWRFIASGSLAYSPDPVVDTDKFSLGGPDNVRGFLSAEQRGDRGVLVTLELQRSIALGSLPSAAGVFVDSGKVWNLETAGTPARNQGLSSAGIEWLVGPSSGAWNARLQWAWAVGSYQPSDGNNGGHIWFTLGMSF
ncbi:MAG TPA: ShlB/FhaC/HecB family hemolysin secretion/activation protein [Gammaproteobacteria bacterium]|nr:ShlB/FhaC/HecB family hemolysin secretion/activation protein [Gammaproteobacteria bacterium]